MIGPEYVRTMARYNAWQNRSLYEAASGLPDEARHLDRGAFFGSIHGTLCHLLWGDTIWMSRFDGWEAPGLGIPDSSRWIETWDDLAARRVEADRRIGAWAAHLTEDRLRGDLTWYSGAMKRDLNRPMSLLVVHFFNHQAHHRGQVHAMLTAAGAKPDDTDLPFMPDEG